MKLGVSLLLVFSLGLKLTAQEKPKITIGIVVDQMRYEYLQRYESKFVEGGFKRLMTEGFNAKNAHYNYAPTYTGPGHASVYTGTTPRYHGIIANDWYSRELERPVYCAEDTSVQAVGGSASAGRISPRNMQSSTITDQLALSSNFRSKVVAISLKDRGAALPAGHHPTGAYWYDSKTGEFMTSTFYQSTLPEWVVKFNAQRLPDTYSNQTWSPLLPLKEYVESTADLTPYERGFKGKDTPTFPYELKDLRKHDRYGLIRSTPFGNTLIIEMAKAALEGEKMGQGSVTDFLAMSFSTPDYVGHNFGTHAIETEDTYLRLDRELADFLTYLDQKFGKDEYLIFLTADHGVVENPQFLLDHNLTGGYIDMEKATSQFLTALTAKLGPGDWILDASNDQLFLNRALIAEKKMDLEEVQAKVAKLVSQQSEVLEAFTASDFLRFEYAEPLRANLHRGFHPRLSGDVILLLKPGYLPSTYGKKGTSHGSPFTHDTHVPILFYGKGVKPGSTTRQVFITDIAPTVSFLLDISLPNACTGQPITEAIK